ncbi:hypothetical protein BOX15_Mlig031474g1, partial [Macrostomum lignano]
GQSTDQIISAEMNVSGCENTSTNCSLPGGGRPGFYLSHGDTWLQVLCTYLIPIIAILGVIGNTCSFIILKESATRVSSHFYLCCLSILDSLTLVSIVFSIWLAVIMPGYYYVLYGQVAAWLRSVTSNCQVSQFRVYISFYCRMVSVWTVVILSVERCISVSSPLRWGTRLCTVRNGVWAIGGLVLLAAPFSIYAVFGFEYSEKYRTCRPNDHFFIGNILSNVLFSIVPWIVICISNLVLVLVLRKRNRRSSQMDQKTLRQENSITTRLLVVSVTFLFLTLPLAITSAINSYYELQDLRTHKTGIVADLWMVSFVLFTANFASNFWLYCLTGRNFRRAAVALLTWHLDSMRRLRRRLDRGSDSAAEPPSSKLTAVSSLTGHDVAAKQSAALLSQDDRQRKLRQETNI